MHAWLAHHNDMRDAPKAVALASAAHTVLKAGSCPLFSSDSSTFLFRRAPETSGETLVLLMGLSDLHVVQRHGLRPQLILVALGPLEEVHHLEAFGDALFHQLGDQDKAR